MTSFRPFVSVAALCALLIVSYVPQPAAASYSYGLACEWVSSLCVEATVTNDEPTCVDYGGGERLCTVAYHFRVEVPANRCAWFSFADRFFVESCNSNRPTTFTRTRAYSDWPEEGALFLPEQPASVCILRQGSQPDPLTGCYEWDHPPVLLIGV